MGCQDRTGQDAPCPPPSLPSSHWVSLTRAALPRLILLTPPRFCIPELEGQKSESGKPWGNERLDGARSQRLDRRLVAGRGRPQDPEREGWREAADEDGMGWEGSTSDPFPFPFTFPSPPTAQ